MSESKFSIFPYLNKIEICGWLLCIFSMLTIIFGKELAPEVLPYAWIGAIAGEGLLGWGMGQNRKKK